MMGLPCLYGTDWWDNSFGNFHNGTDQGKNCDSQCNSNHSVNGLCNSLSCTIRLCMIRSESSSTLHLHAHYAAYNLNLPARGQVVHRAASQPSPHPGNISQSGQICHHCHVKILGSTRIQREINDGVVCGFVVFLLLVNKNR